jgi:hypothetical protein
MASGQLHEPSQSWLDRVFENMNIESGMLNLSKLSPAAATKQCSGRGRSAVQLVPEFSEVLHGRKLQHHRNGGVTPPAAAGGAHCRGGRYC